MKILVTGIAGFIGYHLAVRLAEEGHTVIGLDNLNDYYDPSLKLKRLDLLGISSEDINALQHTGDYVESTVYPRQLRFYKIDITDEEDIDRLFSTEKFDTVVHLAAQAGARDSVIHPRKYIKSNIEGFLNILEGCRSNGVTHLIYASSSSVYGLNQSMPFSESDSASHPASLYGATKRSNELMAHTYSHLYGLPTTGLRFFTVYGPWGRPDMAPSLFVDAILRGEKINVFNNGDQLRDFTYIDDIITGIISIISLPPTPNTHWDASAPDASTSSAPYRVLNIGSSNPTRLMDFISIIQKILGKEANIKLMPKQPGDVKSTYSDTGKLKSLTGFSPATPIEDGVKSFIDWKLSMIK